MTRPRSPLFDLLDQARNFGRAADGVARAAESTAQARADGKCLLCGENPAMPGADYCVSCRADAVEAGAGVAKNAIDRIKDALLKR